MTETKNETVPDRHFYIVSHSERGFWSNTKGWVYSLADADSFTHAEVRGGFNLPISADKDAFVFEATEILTAGDTLTFEGTDDDLPLRVLSDRAALQAARDGYQKDGELEIDIPTSDEDCEKALSRGSEHGTYVRAWRYLYWEPEKLEPAKL